MMQLDTRNYALVRVNDQGDGDEFAREVLAGLTARHKRLPCRFLYDKYGSQLFEAICAQPEYYPTRCEYEILNTCACDIADCVRDDADIVELGSGSSIKTRIIIEEFARRLRSLRYIPIDISEAILDSSSQALLADYPGMVVYAVVADYQEGLRHLRDEVFASGLILWLGSSIGNFEPGEAAAFLRGIADAMRPDDRFLMGVDLMKDPALLVTAYSDAGGVTERFNRNILRRINRELGGAFKLHNFAHRVVLNMPLSRVEMHLVSTRRQRVAIQRLGIEVELEKGETIQTENSYKYTLAGIERLAFAAGLRLERQWFDADRLFSVNLFARRE